MNNNNNEFKIVIIGNSNVGKTSLMEKYVNNTFFDGLHCSTIGVDYKIKTIKIKDELIKLNIWDTAGQERYGSITRNCFRGADGVLIAFSIDNQVSFQQVLNWLEQAIKYSETHTVFSLVGTKGDLIKTRSVTVSEIEKFVKEHHLSYMETSSLLSQNIEPVFLNLVSNMKRAKDKMKTNTLMVDSIMIDNSHAQASQQSNLDDNSRCC